MTMQRSSGSKPGRRLILASASPRRRELLAEAGYEFEVLPADVNEEDPALPQDDPVALAEALSRAKALAVARLLGRADSAPDEAAGGDDQGGKPGWNCPPAEDCQSGTTPWKNPPPAPSLSIDGHRRRRQAGRALDGSSGTTVLGADTVVALHGRLYGKAVDVDDARRILGTLMHHPHEVITGVTLVDSVTMRHQTFHSVTRVTMHPMPPAEFEAYLAGGLWRGKAGAYGIQDHDDRFIAAIDGSFSNVMGLPMEATATILADWGHHPHDRR